MKILIASLGRIPSQRAHSVNITKHAQGFYDLGHELKIFTIDRYYEDLLKLKIKDINRFYGISPEINIKSTRDISPFYFKEIFLSMFKKIGLISPLKEESVKNKENHISKLLNFYQKVKTNFYINFYDPEKKISDYCVKNEIDFCYSRAIRLLYYNIKNKIPTVLEYHAPDLLELGLKLAKLKNSIYFKGLITISTTLKEEFIKMGIAEEKILVLEDAVELDKYNSIKKSKIELKKLLNLPTNKKIIMYTGSIIEGRGIDTILDSANFLEDKNLIFYIIGGSAKDIKKWEYYKKRKKKEIEVKFLEFIENRKIPLYHKAADILLAPYSIKCSTVDWMSPIKLFEYMASKVPIIASDVKRIKEICKNHECLFFNHDNPHDLAKKIKEIISNEDLRRILIENSYNSVKNYTYKKRCQKIIDFFES